LVLNLHVTAINRNNIQHNKTRKTIVRLNNGGSETLKLWGW